MKIAFISTIRCYPWGGADALWTAAAEAAQSAGHDLLLVINQQVAEHPRVRALVQHGARVHLHLASSATLASRTLRKLRVTSPKRTALAAKLASFRPDFVLISGGGTYDLLAEPDLWYWLTQSQTPFNYLANWQEPRPVLSGPDRTQAINCFAAAQCVFFVSTANLETTRQHLLIPLANARVVQYPIQLPATPDGLPWPEATPYRLATIARLEPIKGLDLLLHAVAQTLRSETNWTLDMYGLGPDRDYLAQLIAHHGLDDRVRLAGYASIDTIWADHHLLISAACAEGVPLTIPEAMLRGRPVLATNVGGAEDWITPGHNGFICPSATVALLAQTLRAAWQQRTRWADLGQHALTAARVHYQPEDYLLLLPK